MSFLQLVCCHARSVGQCCPVKHDNTFAVQWWWSSLAKWVSRIHSRGLSLAEDRNWCAFSDSRCKYCIFGIMINVIPFNLYRDILYISHKIFTIFCASFPLSWSTLTRNGLWSMYYMFACFWYFVQTLCICFESRKCIFILGSSPCIFV